MNIFKNLFAKRWTVEEILDLEQRRIRLMGFLEEIENNKPEQRKVIIIDEKIVWWCGR